jgi:tripartite-type tricarboxylate transporter receptor subunit TctC
MPKFRLFASAGAAIAVLAFGGWLGGLLGSPAAVAQSKTIKIIVPYTPGSGPDILSRLMSDQIPKDGGPGIVVENRPGGGTLIGTEAAAKTEPDGHTVLLVANSFVINPQLGRGSYDVAKDYEPICYLAGTPMVLVVQASSPYKTLQDLVAAMKAQPGMAFASGGPGSSLHVAIEVLRLATGTTISYVPYGGSGPRSGGVGRLSDRGVAAPIRHVARSGHHFGQAHRLHAGRPVAERDRYQQVFG